MRKPVGSIPRERALSDDEVQAVWNGLPTTLARSKACASSSCVWLRPSAWVKSPAWQYRSSTSRRQRGPARTKNKRKHAVPLSTTAVELIKEAIADAGERAEYVFPSNDGEGPLSPLVVAKTVLRAQKVHEERPHGRFGIPHWTAHDLRRTALTNFAALGIPPVVAGAVANHVSVTKATITLAVYTQYIYEKEKREALNMWADRLVAIVKCDGAVVVPLRREG